MAATMSEREYANHRKANGLHGGTRTAVRKALISGRIHRSADGRIDPEQADRDWLRNTDPTQGKPIVSIGKGVPAAPRRWDDLLFAIPVAVAPMLDGYTLEQVTEILRPLIYEVLDALIEECDATGLDNHGGLNRFLYEVAVAMGDG